MAMGKRGLGTFKAFDLNQQIVSVDVMREITIDATDLSKEMANQPGLYAWYGALHEVALARMKEAKYLVHCTKEDLDKEIREAHAKEKGEEDESPGRLTEKAIENKINRAPDMRKAYTRYMRRSREAGLLRVLRDAFEQRAAMLQSIGANKRAEFEQGDLKTLQKKARHVTRSMTHSRDGDDSES